MIIIKTIDDISKITLDQNLVFMIKSLNFDPEKLFILIRNLGLHPENVALDFSEYDNQQEILEKWIVDYLNSDIQIDLNTLNKELSIRILDYLKYWKLIDGVPNYTGNYRNFIEQNWGMIDDLCRFLSSSIYYAASLTSKTTFEYESYAIINSFKLNAINIFKYIREFEVELMLKKYKIHNYFMFQEQKFTEKFYKLASTSMYALFLYGQTTPQWKLFQQLLHYC